MSYGLDPCKKKFLRHKYESNLLRNVGLLQSDTSFCITSQTCARNSKCIFALGLKKVTDAVLYCVHDLQIYQKHTVIYEHYQDTTILPMKKKYQEQEHTCVNSGCRWPSNGKAPAASTLAEPLEGPGPMRSFWGTCIGLDNDGDGGSMVGVWLKCLQQMVEGQKAK